jgi:hypothetical protein
MGDKRKGDIVKTQRADTHAARESSETKNEATNSVIQPPLERDTIARLAYFYWEARGCPHDSALEDWFSAEAEIRKQLAATANGRESLDSDLV